MIFTDASTNRVGSFFIQTMADQKIRVTAWGSTGLKDAQTRYSIYHLEMAAIVLACMKLREYMCTGLPFTIYTDCRALNNLHKIDLANIVAARTQ